MDGADAVGSLSMPSRPELFFSSTAGKHLHPHPLRRGVATPRRLCDVATVPVFGSVAKTTLPGQKTPAWRRGSAPHQEPRQQLASITTPPAPNCHRVPFLVHPRRPCEFSAWFENYRMGVTVRFRRMGSRFAQTSGICFITAHREFLHIHWTFPVICRFCGLSKLLAWFLPNRPRRLSRPSSIGCNSELI
jgi:hypothetical protein